MTALVTGGAGYIGAHVRRALQAAGHQVVVVDDLSTGFVDRVPDDVPLLTADLVDPGTTSVLAEFMAAHGVDSIVHLAARKLVEESVRLPERYLGDNLASLATVVGAMRRNRVRVLLFSSSASVYGAPEAEFVREDDPTVPVNPYGASKLAGEWLTAAAVALGGRAASLRYFNVAGAAEPHLGDRAVLNLVPMIFERLDAGLPPRIFGADYPTPDGTCVRDYVHVADLAEAHVAVLDRLLRPGDDGTHEVYNVGTGTGASVAEIMSAVAAASGIAFTPVIEPRRAGDPPRVVADPSRIRQELGWRAVRGLTETVESAWRAWVHARSTR